MTNAFVLRLSPAGRNMLTDCLARDRIVIGWPNLDDLLIPGNDWLAFRQIVFQGYHGTDTTMHGAGSTAGHLWRFIRDMKEGDLVVAPGRDRDFYVAEVQGPAQQGSEEHVGYWRVVRWLNDKKPVQRRHASAALQSRMKVRGSSSGAGDLVEDIRRAVEEAKGALEGRAVPVFEDDLRRRLLIETQHELRTGKVDSYKFEHIVQVVLDGLGAKNSAITDRRSDKGDDVVATVSPLGRFNLVLVAQVKHYYQLDQALGKSVLDELLSGMAKHSADLGLVITVGTISKEAEDYAAELNDQGKQIALINGEELAELYLEHCIAART